MLTLQAAKQVVQAYLEVQNPSLRNALMVLDDATIDLDYGWVFFYDSRAHIETGEIKHAIAGNAPILVEQADGSLHVLGTAYPLEHYIREYESSTHKRLGRE